MTYVVSIAVAGLIMIGTGAMAQTQAERTATASDQVTLRMPGGQVFTATRSAMGLGGAGPLSAMCCGTVNPDDMEGDNCAFLGAGRTCAGDILACPGGEMIGPDGKGACIPAMMVR